jgi:hypothetical protein
MTSFPTGILRFAGNWSNSQKYLYGMYVLDTGVSYACGAVSDTGTDPTVQPSEVWFPFPPSGGGGNPSEWSQYPATQSVNMEGNKLMSAAADGTSITLADDISISATTGNGNIYLYPSATGAVDIGGDCEITGFLGVDTIHNVGGSFGAENQQLTSDGSKIQWYSPTLLENQRVLVSTPISTTGTTLFTSVTQGDRPSSSAFITVSINYKSTAAGQNILAFDLKYLIGAGPSTSLDEVDESSTGNGDLGSCSLCGVISEIPPATNLQVIVIATGDGVGHFTVERASMVVMYNMAPTP